MNSLLENTVNTFNRLVSPNPEPSPVTGGLYIGKVLQALPYFGVYSVAVTGANRVTAVPISLYGARVNGVKDVPSYLPGSNVLLYNNGTTGQHDVPQWVILGHLESNHLTPDSRNVYDRVSEFNFHGGNSAYAAIDHQIPQTTSSDNGLKTSYAMGKPIDAAAGEYLMCNAFGGGFFLSDFMASTKASEACRLDLFLYDDAMRVTSNKFEQRQPLFEDRLFRWKGWNRITSVTQSIAESFGSLKEDQSYLEGKPEDSTATGPEGRVHVMADKKKNIPFISKLSIAGAFSDGELTVMATPPDAANLKSDTKDRPAGLLSVAARYDGTYAIKAARELSFEKGVDILTPLERNPSDFVNDIPIALKRELWDDTHKDLTLDAASAFGLRFIKDYDDWSATKVYPRMRELLDNWDLPEKLTDAVTALNKAKTSGDDLIYDRTLLALEEDSVGYGAPERKAKVKPYSDDGKRETEYDVNDRKAGLRVLPDGSLVIYGGCGEELRMANGNITWTCPGDMRMQPGKDLLIMVPRHAAIKTSDGIVEITSKTGVTLGSSGNVQICAAMAGGDGVLLLENKSKTGKPNKDMLDDKKGLVAGKPVGGGVVIKSNNITTIAKNTWIGSSPKDFADARIELVAGALKVNAGKETHYIENVAGGESFTVMFKQNTAFSLSPYGANLITYALRIGASSLLAVPSEAEGAFVDHAGKWSKTSLTTGSMSAFMDASVLLNSVSSVSGSLGQEKYKDFRKSVKDATITRVEGTTDDEATVKPLYTEEDTELLNKLAFIFPAAAGYKTTKFYLPVSWWQSATKADKKWEEPKAVSATDDKTYTMPYPGKDVWETKGSLKAITKGALEDLVLKDGYTMGYKPADTPSK